MPQEGPFFYTILEKDQSRKKKSYQNRTLISLEIVGLNLFIYTSREGLCRAQGGGGGLAYNTL